LVSVLQGSARRAPITHSAQVSRIYVIDDDAKTVGLYDKNTGNIRLDYCEGCTVNYGPKKIVNSRTEVSDGWFRRREQSFDRLTGAYSNVSKDQKIESGFNHEVAETGTCKLAEMPTAGKAQF